MMGSIPCTVVPGIRPRQTWAKRSAACIAALFAVLVVGCTGPAPATERPDTPAPATTTPRETPTRGPKSPSTKPSSIANTSNTTLKEMAPVGLDSESNRPDGVVIALSKIEAVTGEAKLPGDVAGPALRVTVTIQNGSASALGLDSVVVNGYRGAKRVPLEMLMSPGGSPFSGQVGPGDKAVGTYVFRVGTAQRSDVTFTVDVTPGEPSAVFRGDAR